MIYKLTIPYLLEEYFETDEDIKPLNSNIIDWSIEPDTLEIILNPNLDALKLDLGLTVDYLSDDLVDGYHVLDYNRVVINTVNSDTFTVNEIVWCENEPMTVVTKVSSTRYLLERLFSRTHIYSSGILTKSKPLSVIGLIGYISDESDNIVKRVYISEINTSGAGAIVILQDILKLYDNNYPLTLGKKGINSTTFILSEVGLNRYVSGYNYLGGFNFVEDWDNSTFFKACNPFEVLINNLKLNGKFLSFSTSSGKYEIITPQQPNNFITSTNVDFDDTIDYTSVYDFRVLVSGIKISVKANTFKLEQGTNNIIKDKEISFMLNFGNAFNGSVEEVEFDATNLIAPTDNYNVQLSEIETIKWLKSKILNGIASTKQLSFGILRMKVVQGHSFSVGDYYNINDKHNFNFFLKSDIDFYALCMESTNNEVAFLILHRFNYAPISPSLLMRYYGIDETGYYKFTLSSTSSYYIPAPNIDDYFGSGRGSSLETANISNTLIYESGDPIRLINLSTLSGYSRTIRNISGIDIYITNGTSLTVGQEYLVIFPISGASATTKQKKFLYVGGNNV